MKKLKLLLLAIRIEYHWWCFDSLKKKTSPKTNPNTHDRKNFHKYRAEQLMVLYEKYLGLRDYYGNIIA